MLKTRLSGCPNLKLLLLEDMPISVQALAIRVFPSPWKRAVDSVGKKVSILDGFIEKLELPHVSTYAGRIEDLARERPGEFAVVTARALAKLSVLMELACPLLQQGGRLVCYKAHVDDEEFAHARSLQEKLGMKLVSDRSVSLGDNARRIIVFERVGNPSISLPRRTGMAQKKPL